MNRRHALFVARGIAPAALLCAASSAVWAGPPFRTDDPEAVEFKHSELYLFYQQTLSADGRAGVAPAFEFNYGIVENVQLHLVAPVAFTTPSGMGTTRGYGDTELGVKWQLNEETDSLPMIGVFPMVEVSTGNADKGLGSGHTQVFLPVWLQKKWGDFQTYGGGGYWFNNGTDSRNYWFFGWQAQYQLSEHLTLGGEVFHSTEQTVGQGASTGFNLGGFYNISEHHHVLFSAGKGLQNAAQTNRVSSYLGYQFTF
jgi:hypothetical protein